MAARERPTVFSQLLQAAGLIAGVAVLVYIAGGIVVLWRLWLQRYNRVATVVQLPRELLISIGLLAIVLPFIAGVAIYAIVRLSTQVSWLRSLIDRPTPWLRPLQRFVLSMFYGVGLFVASFLWAEYRTGLDVQRLPALSTFWRLLALSALFGLLGLVFSSVALWGRNWVVARRPGFYKRGDIFLPSRSLPPWPATASMAAMSAFTGLAIIPIGFMIVSFAPLEFTKVCTGRDEIVGRLIGEARDRIYVGELDPSSTKIHRVLSIPNSAIERVFITGRHEAAFESNCVLEPPRRSPKAGPPPEGGEGDRGERGPTGPTGPKGDNGDKGDQGRKGATGDRGPRGYPGPRGDRGPAGPRGPRGFSGED